ncbi:MAG: hypothetical protein N2578_03715 [Bdellovibrionaceae bacterium]|nr:hypothetical protein [Pseudobdellovibrionaceae bacterium]
MNQILGVLFFVTTMVWSWNIVHSASPNTISEETHLALQENFGKMIIDVVKTKRPAAVDFEITKLWTETIDHKRIRARFQYTLTEGSGDAEVKQVVDGLAVLFREPNTADNGERWVIEKVQTTNDSLSFTEGTLVSPTPSIDEVEDPSLQQAKPPSSSPQSDKSDQ